MTFNIEDFKSRGLALGGARPTLFYIQAENWPYKAGAAPVGAPSKLSFTAKASQLPPSIISQVQVPYYGRTVKAVGDRTYPNWAVSIYNDEDFLLRDAIEGWHNALNSEIENLMRSENTLQNFPSGYKVDFKITQQARDGRDLRTYTMVGAFPVSIEAIPVDWEAVNQIELFDVEFAYDYWLPYERAASESVSDIFTGESTEVPGLP